MDGLILPPAEWRHRPGLDRLVAALGEARFVGGSVRDTLLGLPVADIDIATPLPPEEVIARLKDSAIRCVPTGLKHGTITAVLDDGPVEVTTLRRDVDTDGRRATVAFSTDWREDAARRDFTINALYADPISAGSPIWRRATSASSAIPMRESPRIICASSASSASSPDSATRRTPRGSTPAPRARRI